MGVVYVEKQKSKKQLSSTLEDWLHLPTGTVGKGSKIAMIDNRELCIEGCRGILSYSQEEMRLHCGQRQLSVKGSNLLVKTLSRNYVEIEGTILSVEFA